MSSLCIACLSFRKPQVLQRTLETYRQCGLLDYANERLVYFNGITAEDQIVAQLYGFRILGSDKNMGIGRAFRTMALNAESRYIMFLENDFALIESQDETLRQLDACQHILRYHRIDAIKLRHKTKPGEPLYSRGKVIPTHLLGMIHWTDQLPPEIHHGCDRGVEFWYTTAEHANYTNNPCMYNRRWFLREVGPFCTGGGIALEGDIQTSWEKRSDIWVAQTNGLFSHRP